MKQALMSQYESAKGENAMEKDSTLYLRDLEVHVNYLIFRVCFVFRLFSCLFRVST